MTEKSLEHDVRVAASLTPIPRKTFVELCEIKSLDEVAHLSREDFIGLCEDHPNAMAELFIDLMSENRKLKTLQTIAKVNNASAG